MHLHLGQETLVNTRSLIGIFDLDTTTISKDTRAFLARAEKAGQVVNVSMELPRSFVVAAQRGQTVYVSQLSSATLKHRHDTQQNRKTITDTLL